MKVLIVVSLLLTIGLKEETFCCEVDIPFAPFSGLKLVKGSLNLQVADVQYGCDSGKLMVNAKLLGASFGSIQKVKDVLLAEGFKNAQI